MYRYQFNLCRAFFTDQFVSTCAQVNLDPFNAGAKANWTVEYFKFTICEKFHYFYGPYTFEPDTKKPGTLSHTFKREDKRRVVEYTVTFWTSDIKQAGTDAIVNAQLTFQDVKGSERESPVLEISSTAEDFEPRGEDQKVVKTYCFGRILKLKLWHNGKEEDGIRSDWHIRKVAIEGSSTPTCVLMNFHYTNVNRVQKHNQH